MSEMVTYKGKLKELDINVEEFCKQQLLLKMTSEELRNSLKNGYGCKDLWLDECSYDCDDYMIVNNIVYKVLFKKDMQFEDIFECTKNKNDEIEFLVQYYNGGCGFEEAIENALERIDKGLSDYEE